MCLMPSLKLWRKLIQAQAPCSVTYTTRGREAETWRLEFENNASIYRNMIQSWQSCCTLPKVDPTRPHAGVRFRACWRGSEVRREQVFRPRTLRVLGWTQSGWIGSPLLRLCGNLWPRSLIACQHSLHPPRASPPPRHDLSLCSGRAASAERRPPEIHWIQTVAVAHILPFKSQFVAVTCLPDLTFYTFYTFLTMGALQKLR